MSKGTGPAPAVRRQVIARDGSRCQWCGGYVQTDSGWYSLQHRRARGMGGSKSPLTNLPSNLLLVHGSGTTYCHGEIEANPSAAAARGFRLKSGATPELVPFVDSAGGSWRLLNDGRKVPA